MILVENLTIQVKNFKLNNINLKIETGEIFAILGKTGAGKSMLLEAIAGFYKPDIGTTLINDTDVCSLAPSDRKIGFVYQDYGLFPHMNVYDNISYGLRMNHVKKSEANIIINDIMNLLEINSIAKNYPATLSGGEKQRTALARALVLQPDVLLLDEPFSALDPNTRKQIYQLIQKIHYSFPCTIIFVTHNFEEAQKLANRIGIMIEGELKMVCGAGRLFAHYDNIEINNFLGGNKNDSE